MKCQYCGNELNDKDVFCQECGNKITNKTQIGVCKKCNYPIFEGDKFCSYCGYETENCGYETEIHCEPALYSVVLLITIFALTIFGLILLQYFNR